MPFAAAASASNSMLSSSAELTGIPRELVRSGRGCLRCAANASQYSVHMPLSRLFFGVVLLLSPIFYARVSLFTYIKTQ